MDLREKLTAFYKAHIPHAKFDGKQLVAPCPLCSEEDSFDRGEIRVQLNPDSLFMAYFWCSNRCTPGGFAPHFARKLGLDPKEVPGHDPDREPFALDIFYPIKNLNPEIKKYTTFMDEERYEYFYNLGISSEIVDGMEIGYNGRYLVYPYFMENGSCYAARCILPDREEDFFWHGNEKFFEGEFRIFNLQEIERCENGAIFITEGENNLLTLKELNFPAISVPSAADLENIDPERLSFINHVLLIMNQTPEAEVASRDLATRLGYKARMIRWPSHLKRGYSLCHLSREKGGNFKTELDAMISSSKSFSPFSSPEKEQRKLYESLDRGKGKRLLGVGTGFEKMDSVLNGIRGINIMGGPPKAGKSCFFIQISTEAARRKNPVIYYDFENGRQKIYSRTLSRLSKIHDRDIMQRHLDEKSKRVLEKSQKKLNNILPYFRVVTDRKLNPDIMRRHIDFLQHETHTDYSLVVIDSLHKLPFKDLSDRRTGIDAWLRHFEAIRDEQNVSFLVISELSRDKGGGYTEKPDLGSFKESGDIEYSADNAMILWPNWDPLDPITTKERETTLWLVASRESSPGEIASYHLEYPYWGFREL
jgi:KaiC/GvpD/RAD55 family RecA-like ATPase